jgi:7-keto-8-aminopelargonate synthetase-like enzyme
MTTHSAAAEQKAILVETEQAERKSVVDDFAGYRALRRRVDEIEGAGLENPFFQPRDGVSHSVIRRNERSLVSFSGYNYLGLNGHPAVTAAAKNAIDKYGTSASASRIVAGPNRSAWRVGAQAGQLPGHG